MESNYPTRDALLDVVNEVTAKMEESETVTLTVPVTATVHVKTWANEYGQSRAEARDDIPRHLRALIEDTVLPHHRYLIAGGTVTVGVGETTNSLVEPGYRPSAAVRTLVSLYVDRWQRPAEMPGISMALLALVGAESGWDAEAVTEYVGDMIEEAVAGRG